MENEIVNSWPLDAFDAISIRAPDCKISIQGKEGEQTELKGDFNKPLSRDWCLEPSGRWLRIHLPSDHRSNQKDIKLELPVGKAWILDISCGKGDIKVSDIQARMQIKVGRGDIRITQVKGVISAWSGHANIHIRRFIQSEMPELSDRNREDPLPSNRENHGNGPGWLLRSENEWEDWGEDLGEKIGRWATGVGSWFAHFGVDRTTGKDAGLNLQTAAGNIKVDDIEARAGIIRLIKGNLQMAGVDIENLEINLTSGNIEGKSVMPSGNWKIKSVRGNVHFSLPEDIRLRLDMATRSGNIYSEIPLVRVARQGPESCSGSRMVGTIGTYIEGKMPELHISAVRGNIDIKPGGPVGSRSAADPIKNGPVTTSQAGGYDDRLKILTSLQEGKISIDEADRLLRSLDS